MFWVSEFLRILRHTEHVWSGRDLISKWFLWVAQSGGWGEGRDCKIALIQKAILIMFLWCNGVVLTPISSIWGGRCTLPPSRTDPDLLVGHHILLCLQTNLKIWGAVLLFNPYLWISENWFMDILKYIFGYPKISWLLDIHNSIFGYPKMNYGYPKIHPDFWISINQFLDIQKISWILDIHFDLWISKNELWIS